MMDANRILEVEKGIVAQLKTVFDPEIPVNVYDLGLIYEIDVEPDGYTTIRMTLTAPNCPMAEAVIQDVNDKTRMASGVTDVTVILTFDPPWDKDMMSEEAKLELGFL
jgi:FeS assembly SUF system protein